MASNRTESLFNNNSTSTELNTDTSELDQIELLCGDNENLKKYVKKELQFFSPSEVLQVLQLCKQNEAKFDEYLSQQVQQLANNPDKAYQMYAASVEEYNNQEQTQAYYDNNNNEQQIEKVNVQASIAEIDRNLTAKNELNNLTNKLAKLQYESEFCKAALKSMNTLRGMLTGNDKLILDGYIVEISRLELIFANYNPCNKTRLAQKKELRNKLDALYQFIDSLDEAGDVIAIKNKIQSFNLEK